MKDRIIDLKAELQADPGSLAFRELGALLRLSGDLNGAERVVAAGLARHPGYVEARALYGEILLDRGNLIEAFRQWSEVLETDPRSMVANKGLGFLYFKGGRHEEALEHLEVALSVDPTDEQVRTAFFRVRSALDDQEPLEARAPDETEMAAATAGPADTMLVDSRGRPLTGAIESAGSDVSENVAAYLVTVTDEAVRTSHMLELGEWQWIVCESERGCLHVSKPTEDSHLILVGGAGTRPAEIEMRAETATASAVQWLGQGYGS